MEQLHSQALFRALDYVFAGMNEGTRTLLKDAEIRLGSHSKLDAPYVLFLFEEEEIFKQIVEQEQIRKLTENFAAMLPRFILGFATYFPFSPTKGELAEKFQVQEQCFCILKEPGVVEVYPEAILVAYCEAIP